MLCSGKVAYDLIEARDAAGLDDVSIVRIEQLYPFPGEPLAIRLARMTNLEEVVWCQEEPKNNGAWFFVESQIEEALTDAGKQGMRAALCRARACRLARHRPRHAPQGRSRRRWSPMRWACDRSRRRQSALAKKPDQGTDRTMSTEVKVPTLGESVTEATIGEWLKKPGEAVEG